MRPNLAVTVSETDRKVLQSWVRSSSVPARLANRARIVLLAADGMGTQEITARLGVTKQTVISWKKRYLDEGLSGLEDRPKPGRTPQIDETAIIAATCHPPPPGLGVTHWSSRQLAKELRCSHVTIAKVWQKRGVQPRGPRTFRFATNPELEAEISEVVGIYVGAEDNVAVLLAGRDRGRDGAVDDHAGGEGMDTATLRTAFDVATSAQAGPRGRQSGLSRFLTDAAAGCPGTDLRLVCDDRTLRRNRMLRDWIESNPGAALHVAATTDAWFNLLELFIAICHRDPERDEEKTTQAAEVIRSLAYGRSGLTQPFVWTSPRTGNRPIRATATSAPVSTPTVNPTRRTPPERRRSTTPEREKIIEVAAKLFEQRGFRNTTMQDVADELGIAKPTLYVYVRSKSQILEAIFERVLAEGDNLIDAASTRPAPAERLQMLIYSWTATAVNLSSHYHVFVGDEHELPPELARRVRDWSAEALVRLRNIILDGQEKKVFDPTLDPTTVVFTILALPNWTARWFREARDLSVEDVSETYYRILSRGLRAE